MVASAPAASPEPEFPRRERPSLEGRRRRPLPDTQLQHRPRSAGHCELKSNAHADLMNLIDTRSIHECKDMLRKLRAPALRATVAVDAAAAAEEPEHTTRAFSVAEPPVGREGCTPSSPLDHQLVEPLSSDEFVHAEPLPSNEDEAGYHDGVLVSRARSCDSAWWCGTIRAIHQIKELSVLELERQVGLQGSLSMSSFGSVNSLQQQAMLADGQEPKPLVHRRAHSRSLELSPRDMDQLLQEPELPRDVGLSLDAVDPVHADNRHERHDAPEDMPDVSTHEPAEEGATTPTAEAAASTLSPADAYLFEAVFEMHPFAAAAFLRAFISCSFGLTFFHIHSLMAWPMELDPATQHWPRAKEWLILQIVLLLIQTPIRMALQRKLHSVSVAADTQEAARRLRVIFLSPVWSWNKSVGYCIKAASLMGLWVLSYSGVLWHGLDEAQAAALTIEESHLISICSSSLLITMMRICLALSLLYFVQLAQPQPTSDAKKQGLSAGTIQHLRRVVWHPPSPNVRDPNPCPTTQCTVCLAEYEDGDVLIVLPCDRRHNFHKSCIEPWLQRMNTCPLCQSGVHDSYPDK